MVDDPLPRLRAGEPCAPDRKCRIMEARSGCLCAYAADEIERLQKAAVPEGWALVPVEATEVMVHDGALAHDLPSMYMVGPSMAGMRRVERMYRAMLAAAPQPPSGESKA